MTYTITGNGVAQTVFANLNIIDFGKVRVGLRKDSAAVLIRNDGASPVVINSKQLIGPDNLQFVQKGPGAPYNVAANGTHIDTLCFVPKRKGKTSSQIACNFGGIGSPLITILQGEGYGVPIILAPDSCIFKPIACNYTAKDTTIYIENIGDSTLTVASTNITGINASSFTLVRNLTNAKILPNKKDSVIIRFDEYKYGTHLARLVINNNSDLKDSVKYIDIKASRDNSQLELIGATCDFGQVQINTTSTKSFKIVNKGNQPLTFNTPINLGPFTITSITPSTLANYNDTALATVRLITNNVANRNYDTSYTFADNCGRSYIATFHADKTASNALISVNNTLNIPVIACQTSKDTLITITNTGTSDLYVESAVISGTNSSEFKLVPNFIPMTITAGLHSTLGVSFVPNSVGSASAILTLKSNAVNVVDSISVINLQGEKDTVGFKLTTGNQLLSSGDTIMIQIPVLGATIDTVITIQNQSTYFYKFKLEWFHGRFHFAWR